MSLNKKKTFFLSFFNKIINSIIASRQIYNSSMRQKAFIRRGCKWKKGTRYIPNYGMEIISSAVKKSHPKKCRKKNLTSKIIG